MVGFKEVKAAYERIKDIVRRTPVMTSTTLDRITGCRVFCKCENLQCVGAFKFRGAYNALVQLTAEERKRGVIAHSSGNHAQAVALAAKLLGISATIVMPENSSPVKLDATRSYGAKVVLCDSNLSARIETTQKLIKKHNFVLVHPYDDPRIISGAGTAALELIQEVGSLDYVFAPIGGGGLISGTALATHGLCPDAQVFGVEPLGANDAYRSFQSGHLVPSINPNTIADGLLTSLSDLTFSIIRQHVKEIITVTDPEIIEAMHFLWERMKLVIEPSGAVSLAGVFKIREELVDERVGVILSGGNIDLNSFFKEYSRHDI